MRGCAVKAEVLELGWPVNTSILSLAVVRDTAGRMATDHGGVEGEGREGRL